MAQTNVVAAAPPDAGVPVTVTVLVPRLRAVPVIRPAGEIASPGGRPGRWPGVRPGGA